MKKGNEEDRIQENNNKKNNPTAYRGINIVTKNALHVIEGQQKNELERRHKGGIYTDLDVT